MDNKKTIIIATSCISVLVIAIIFIILSPKTKTYNVNGLKIKAINNLEEKKTANITAYLESKDIKIAGIKEKFTDIEDEKINASSTVQEYASRVAKLNDINVSSLYKLEKTNYIYYTYYKDKYVYISLFSKEKDSFWIVYFIAKEDKDEELFKNVKKWARSLELD